MLRTVFGTALEGLYNALNVNSGRWSETPADTRRHRRACEHQDWYEKTLASYERCFQTCPPSDSFAKSDLNRHTFDETTQSVSPGTLSGLQSADPLEREVLSMAAVDGSIRRVRVAAANATHEIHERLAREVLLVTGLQDKLMSGIPALLLSCILLLGVAKVLIGIDRHRPVLFLVVLCGMTLVPLVFRLRGTARSRRGRAYGKPVWILSPAHCP
jgi:hypothetical protein